MSTTVGTCEAPTFDAAAHDRPADQATLDTGDSGARVVCGEITPAGG